MPDRHLPALIAGAAALLALAPEATAQTKRVSRVGVVVAVHVNMSEQEAQKLGEEIGEGLREALVIDVVAGGQAARRLPASGVGELCVAKPECVRDTASRLDADQLLFLVVVRLGKRVQVEPTWTDATGSQTASRDTIVLEEKGPSAREVFAGAAGRLLPDVTPRGTSTPIDPVTDPPSGSTTTPGGAATPPGTGDVISSGPVTTRRRIHLGTWIAGGVALAALAGGVAFGLAAKSAESDLEEEGCGDRTMCADSRIDSLERKALLADIFYGTAVVAAGAAVFIQLRWGTAAEPPPVSVAPTSSGDGAALLVRGRF